MPEASYPPYEERGVIAEYGPPAAGRVRVPASDEAIVVQRMETDPEPAGESFEDGARFLLVPAGCERFVVRCRYRVYRAGSAFPSPSSLFPGAKIREWR